MMVSARKISRLLFLFLCVLMCFSLLWISSRLRDAMSGISSHEFEERSKTEIAKGKQNVIFHAGALHGIYRPPDATNSPIDLHAAPKPNTKITFDGIDHVQEMKQLNKAKVAADNQRLVELIRDYYIVPPSTEPYDLEFPEKNDSSVGQASIVDSRLKYKVHGFYVESGAFDGETLSNTLFFEQRRDWMGILIEPNPVQYKRLASKHRKAFSVNACLSTEEYPSEKVIVNDDLTSKIIQGRSLKSTYTVQCFPLYSVLLALDQTDIDYLSLDVEGHEKGVLGTIPWNKVNIQMMTIEYNKYPGGERLLCKDMESRGYECVAKLAKRFVDDVVLTKKTN